MRDIVEISNFKISYVIKSAQSIQVLIQALRKNGITVQVLWALQKSHKSDVFHTDIE